MEVVGNNVNSTNEELPKTVAEIKADPELQKIARQQAEALKNQISSNWFTAMQVRDKFKIDFAIVIAQLEALKTMGFIHEREGKFHEKEYKVVFSQKDKVKLLEADVLFYEKKIEIIKKEITKIKEKIKPVKA